MVTGIRVNMSLPEEQEKEGILCKLVLNGRADEPGKQ
jgi:hypothetical protein